jgi:hypothetical protein
MALVDGKMAGSLLSALTRPDATILSVYAAHEALRLKNDLFLSPAIVNTSKMGGSNLHTSMPFFWPFTHFSAGHRLFTPPKATQC